MDITANSVQVYGVSLSSRDNLHYANYLDISQHTVYSCKTDKRFCENNCVCHDYTKKCALRKNFKVND